VTRSIQRFDGSSELGLSHREQWSDRDGIEPEPKTDLVIREASVTETQRLRMNDWKPP
jgi:hypothetical protein